MSYCFDDFTLDTRTRRLLSADEEVHLSPKAFELLLLLIQNRARAMSKAELHQMVWPSSYVAETNLASLVAEIRRALRDSSDEPRYVRTVHRFGYWFIGPAREVGNQGTPGRPGVRYWLVWEARQIPLFDGENVLGRGPDAGVWIDAPGVSRHHARILLEGGRAILEDLGSKNGTYLGGHRVQQGSELTDGDLIRLGSVVVTFRIPQSVGSTETVCP